MRSWLHIAAAGALLGPAACGPPAPEGPNVLLITVDSLRADRLGCMGYERDTTPNLDALAAEGLVFERAYSHAPFTAPSHASLLTSLHTQSHGVLAWEERLAPEAVTMGERFGAAGWRTGAFYNHPGLITSEVTRGFDEVWLRYFGAGTETVDALLDWVDADDRPFAAWMHLWDVHRPYAYRDWTQEWMEKVPPELIPPRDELAFGEERFGPGAPGGDLSIGRTEGFYNLNDERRTTSKPTARGQRLLDEEDLRFIRDRYDGGVRFADRELGRLFAALRERGLLDDTLVVVTADHGESLTEREACFFTHDPFLFEETLRVPLVVRFPVGFPGAERAGTRSGVLARGIDVLPTMLQVAGLATRASDQGQSLIPALEGREKLARTLLAQTQTHSAKERNAKDKATWLEHRRAFVSGDLKLIQDLSAGTWTWYDLAADPGERAPLPPTDPRLPELEQLREQLEALVAALPVSGQPPRKLTPAQEELLQKMGYAGGDEDEEP